MYKLHDIIKIRSNDL